MATVVELVLGLWIKHFDGLFKILSRTVCSKFCRSRSRSRSPNSSVSAAFFIFGFQSITVLKLVQGERSGVKFMIIRYL